MLDKLLQPTKDPPVTTFRPLISLLLPLLLALALPLASAETKGPSASAAKPSSVPVAAKETKAPEAKPKAPEAKPKAPEAKPIEAPTAPLPPTAAPPAHESTHWLIRKYREGGFVMHIFLLVSIWMVAALIERFIRLRRSAIVPDGLLEEAEQAWCNGDDESLAKACRAKPSILADMILYAYQSRGASGADILAGATEISSRGIRKHMQKLTPLAIITTLGPILGLFGAVIGLIECFEAMKNAGNMGDVKQIAGGIAIAFIATATGMAVAMPALVGYHMLKLRTNQLLIALEQDFSGLITRRVIRAGAAEADGQDG